MIEQNTVAGEEPVPVAIVHSQRMCGGLVNAIGTAGFEGRAFNRCLFADVAEALA
jgi:hypothetical protein